MYLGNVLSYNNIYIYILTKQPIDHVFKSHSTSLLLLPPLSALPLHLLHPPYPEYHVYLVLHLLRRQNQQRKIWVSVHKTTVAVIMLIHTYFAYEPLSIILYYYRINIKGNNG